MVLASDPLNTTGIITTLGAQDGMLVRKGMDSDDADVRVVAVEEFTPGLVLALRRAATECGWSLCCTVPPLPLNGWYRPLRRGGRCVGPRPGW